MLAGGKGRRIGGDKATVELAGRPLILYATEALRALCDKVVIVAKADTALPPLEGTADVWVEPDEPRHPLTGLTHALRTAPGVRVLVLACDMPCVPEALLRALVDAVDGPGAVARTGGRLEPLCACYTPLALPGLAHFDPTAPVTEVVEALGMNVVDWDDADALISINAPEDLLRAQVLISRT